MMRSPPPPQPASTGPGNYGAPYGGDAQAQPAAAAGGPFAPAFGGFMNDPTAQMGFQVGKTAMMAGQEYAEQNVCAAVCPYKERDR